MKKQDNLKAMYRQIHPDLFPRNMEISFYDEQQRQTLFYEKVDWVIDGERKGLRYGENPDQEAALYQLVNGNLCLGEVECIQSGRFLASQVELLQSGKHPGKINITDADSALSILRYFHETPCCVIVKHNNPCGVARDEDLATAYHKAFMADRIAAFGGVVALNREVDGVTAELIAEQYCEVVVAPEFSARALELFSKKKNLRVMKIGNMNRLRDYVGRRVLDFKSLMDGGIIAQWSFAPRVLHATDFLRAETVYRDQTYRMKREPTASELDDLLFGWLVEAGITSNSVLYVKDGVTVGIGTGEQDRVGVAEIARDKAYRKLAERIAWERHQVPFAALSDTQKISEIEAEVASVHGGLSGSAMISDGFFPFRDGVDVGIREGVTAICQPGGSVRDYEVIQACNENDVAMVFTGQRSFRH